MSSGIKYKYEEAKEIIENFGYELISDYSNASSTITLIDINGFLYNTRLSKLIEGHFPEKFSIRNPYTILNIKLWLSKYKNEYELVDTEYKSSEDKLTFRDAYGYLYILNIQSMVNRSFKKFIPENKYTINNIHLYLRLNNKRFELVSDKYEDIKKKLKWRCLNDKCNELFDTSLDSILSEKGCPYCCIPARKVGLSNCLATKNPELATEWHPTKNGNLTPYDVTSNSNKSVWWRCKNNSNHEWKVAICNRNLYNRNCPYCTHQLPSKEYNLLVCNPELCKEWDYNKNKKNPEEYNPHTPKKVWWICKECGYSWCTSINNRSKGINNKGKGTGCSKCNESMGEKQVGFILTKYNISHDMMEFFIMKNNMMKIILRY